MLRFTRFGLSGRIHQRKVKKQPSASLLASVTPEGGRDGPINGVLTPKHPAEIVEICSFMSSARRRRNNSLRDETIFRFRRRTPETPNGYQGANNNGGKPVAPTGDSQMRTLSIILAFAFVLAGASVAGSVDNSLPGIGTFAYTGSPIVTSAPQAVVVAAR